MKRKVIGLLILFLIFFKPNFIWAENEDSIIFLVDKLSFDLIEDLSIEKYCIGLANFKTRTLNNKETLLLSLNTGRKLTLKEFKENGSKIEYLGDALKDEKLSYIGNENDKLLIVNSNGEVDYEIDEINYDYDWLVENTENLLGNSNVLLISYDFNEDDERVDILKRYLENFGNKNIIIIPEKLAEKDRKLLNRYIVPVIYINGTDSGILTSKSTKRDGFIALEDISAQIKSIYGVDNKNGVGKTIEIIYKDNPLEKIKDIYTSSINLLVIAAIFHGLVYFTQFFVGIKFIKDEKIDNWIYWLYCISIACIPVSIILGLFNFHKNIPLYVFISLLLSFGIAKAINKMKFNFIEVINLLTYILIVLCTIFYPDIIYNSYLGFNNVFYGARYYGLNNGIMGVLLISSILLYFSFIKDAEKEGIKKILGLLIFIINILVLSARFGANTGGFITSVVLFGLVIFLIFKFNKRNIIKLILFLFLGISIFAINMLLDYNSNSKSHAIQFFYRIVNNGFWEFVTMASFKARELIKLTLIPPFSIVLISQILIFRKMKGFIKADVNLKKKAIIILVTTIVGMLINDTGSITFIYMMFFFIFDLIYGINNAKN